MLSIRTPAGIEPCFAFQFKARRRHGGDICVNTCFCTWSCAPARHSTKSQTPSRKGRRSPLDSIPPVTKRLLENAWTKLLLKWALGLAVQWTWLPRRSCGHWIEPLHEWSPMRNSGNEDLSLDARSADVGMDRSLLEMVTRVCPLLLSGKP